MKDLGWHCIYCYEGNIAEKSDAHLFPKQIGGRVVCDSVCRSCNSLIGTKIESRIKCSPFFAYALDVLGLCSKQQAYRQMEVEDGKTGHKWHFKGNELFPAPRAERGISARGDLKHVLRCWEDWIAKRSFHDLDSFRRQVGEGAKLIELESGTLEIKSIPQSGQLTIRGSESFPFDLIAKIVWESFFYFGFGTGSILMEYFTESFHRKYLDGKLTDISINPRFYERIRVHGENYLNGKHDLTCLTYEPFHFIDFGITDRGILYTRICFFGLVTILIALGDMKGKELRHKEMLINRYFFPFEGKGPVSIPFPEDYMAQIPNGYKVAHEAWEDYRNCG